MAAARQCERCAAPLHGRRGDARYCSAACRSAARHQAHSGPARPDPARTPGPDREAVHSRASERLDALEASLDRLADALDALAPHLLSVEPRRIARAMRRALDDDEAAP